MIFLYNNYFIQPFFISIYILLLLYSNTITVPEQMLLLKKLIMYGVIKYYR